MVGIRARGADQLRARADGRAAREVRQVPARARRRGRRRRAAHRRRPGAVAGAHGRRLSRARTRRDHRIFKHRRFRPRPRLPNQGLRRVPRHARHPHRVQPPRDGADVRAVRGRGGPPGRQTHRHAGFTRRRGGQRETIKIDGREGEGRDGEGPPAPAVRGALRGVRAPGEETGRIRTRDCGCASQDR